ncbi:MAG: glycoside hydrolase family protein, partial [Eubacteriales bacterium]
GTTWYDYDDLGRLRYVTNQDEATVEYEYNDLGQKTLVRYPDGKEASYTYDDLNRLKTVKDRFDKVTTYDYDKAGRRTTTALPNGVVTSYDYDKASQLKEIAAVNAKGKLLAKYGYEYDDAGNRKVFNQTVEEGVYTTQYFYDPLNQLEKVINPDGSQVGYDYDPVGNRLEMTRVEGDYTTTTKYEYDAVNELTKFNVDGGPFTEFRYDSNGNRTTKIEPDNRITSYQYDFENRLTEVRFHQGKWAGFEYDGDGNRITKLSAMTQPTFKHDNGKGNGPGFTPPGQNKAKKQRADLQYLLMAKGGGGGGKGGGGGNSGGNFDNKGNANEKDKSIGSGADKVKNKDLKIEDREAKKEKAKAKNGYRQKGKYTNKGKHLGWYKNGKLPAEKVEVTYYLNDVSDPLTQVLMTYGEDGKYDAAYTYGLERIEVEDIDDTRPESQDPLYYLYDGLGNVTYMVKPDGNVRDHYRYDEYGKPAPGNSKLSEDGRINLNNTFGYTGEQYDEESNLLYLRARYYEPETGRFLSRDTYEGELENPLSRHMYAYVGNNSVNYVDPTGNIRFFINDKEITEGFFLSSDNRLISRLTTMAKNIGAKYHYRYGKGYVVLQNGRTASFDVDFEWEDNYIWVGQFAEALGLELTYDKATNIVKLRGLKEPGTMQVSDKLISFIADYETFHSKPYRGQDKQNLTIGYGHVIKPGEELTALTIVEAKELLRKDIKVFESYVNKKAKDYNLWLSQQQFDALVSFTFNKGYVLNPKENTLFKQIVNGNATDKQIRESFLMWRNVNGNFSLGVYRRSYDEAEIFIKGDYNRDYPNAP